MLTKFNLQARTASSGARSSRCLACYAMAKPVSDVVSASQSQESVGAGISRRDALVHSVVSTLALSALPALAPSPAAAAGFKKELKKRKLTPEDYQPNEAVGLGIFELEQGKGEPINVGDRVVVHYDCLFKGLDVVSSRSARLLGGNRTIAEPYEYVVGEPVTGVGLKKISEGANGLFAGTSGPKPPQALSRAVLGMRKGGKRSILVDIPELGYPKGIQEIPAGATFELKVEVLDVVLKA